MCTYPVYPSGYLPTSFALLAPRPAPAAYSAVLLLSPKRQQQATNTWTTIKRESKQPYMGSTLPSPSAPSPVPSFHPIIFSSLLPTLVSSWPGLGGGKGGEGGGGGPSANRRVFRFSSEPSGIGTSGWLCMTRRSDARSRYFGCAGEFEILELDAANAFAALAFSRAMSRKFASL